ncbi:MAG: potassium channel protein [Paludibacterium sp.]|uniref:potassium channel family protein n=1 Tax=Paludibacterium sp. TaxID=1917523 RepID=UPI0025FAA8E1|nr:potassium channel protein [Paludibacterium sp.]MBV8046321.1 potassium channel protein [Paludibacterium sp.]MBV8649563.1 potassium channel protein [Paludibacterium sp.]
MKKLFTRKLLFLLTLLLATVLAGTLGYMLIEGWSLLDSLFMTVITVSTIGYGEVHPLDTGGRVFTIILIILGVGAVGYGISSLTLMLFQGDLPLYLKRKKMEKVIARFSDHVILCGLSRTGLYTLDEMTRSGHRVVVIERDIAIATQMEERDIPYIVGDATQDANLLAAGVAQAQAIITCLTSDAENAFVVVTAKSLNTAITAISKAENESTRKKLLAVGADKVVVPSMLGGLSMANSVLRPESQRFFETLHERYPDTFKAEIITAEPRWAGQTLQHFQAEQDGRLLVVALEHPGEEVQFSPSPDTSLKAGTAIMLIRNR